MTEFVLVFFSSGKVMYDTLEKAQNRSHLCKISTPCY